MKHNMKKNILIQLSVFLFAGFYQAYAQAGGESGKIVLPDLTTVISSEEQEEANVKLPVFDDVVVLPNKTSDIELVLEQEEEPAFEAFEPEPVEISSLPSDYFLVQGLIGGGLPSLFTGDFTLSQPESKSPLSINFNHRSTNGFAFSSLADGFYKRNTLVSMGKAFSAQKFLWKVSGSYAELQNGLQDQTESESSILQDTIFAGGSFEYKPFDGFTLGTELKSDFYFRYEDLLSASLAPSWIKGASALSVEPVLNLEWKKKVSEKAGDVVLGFKTDYLFEFLTSSQMPGERSLNRVALGLNFSWQKKIIKLVAAGDVVFGDRINHPVLVPFSAGIYFTLPVYFSTDFLQIELESGLKSTQTKFSDYEKKYSFTGLEGETSEVSDWFSHFKLEVPLKSAFKASAQVDYALTALDNGVWEPDYTDSGYNYGLYTYAQKNHELLSTEFALSFNYKIFSFDAALHSNWLDIPVLQSKHLISFKAALVSPAQKIGFIIGSDWHIDSSDSTPIVNSDFFVKINQAVTMNLGASDLLKLTGKDRRTYAGKYISESGNICFSVKFVL